jgi:hypothetical protein
MTHMNDPTQIQIDHAALAQAETIELFGRLQTEGVDWRVALTGLASAMTQVLKAHCGQDEVCCYFARLAALTMPRADQGA